MSAMTPRLILCLAGALSFAGALTACGKDKPAEAPAAEKVAAESGEPAAKDKEADATGEPTDATAKEDAADAKGARHLPKDRLANRRPPPRHELKQVGADAGETDTTPSPAAAEPPLAPTGEPAPAGEPALEPSAEGTPEAGSKTPPPELAPHVAGAPHPEPVIPASPGLDANRLLPLSVVLEITKAKGLTEAGPLPGIATAPGYVSAFYKGADAKTFGVSIQAWQDPARRESDDRFRRMRLQYPNAEDVQVVSPAKAFFAHFGSIQMLTFVDSVKRVVATVACGDGVCTHDQLAKLAKTVRERL